MVLPFAFLLGPLAIYLVLAALPRGRVALIGIGVAAVVAIACAVVGTLFDGAGVFAAFGFFAASAVTLAAMVQLLRRGLGPDRPYWVYPALVVFGLVAGGWPLLQILRG